MELVYWKFSDKSDVSDKLMKVWYGHAYSCLVPYMLGRYICPSFSAFFMMFPLLPNATKEISLTKVDFTFFRSVLADSIRR